MNVCPQSRLLYEQTADFSPVRLLPFPPEIELFNNFSY
jgi:hypothetical protein